MKKNLILIIFILVSVNAWAQKINFGIKASYTSAKLNESYNNQSDNSSCLNNIDLGVFAECKYGNVTFQPGIIYALKGGDGGYDGFANMAGYSETFNDVSIYYLEIPLNLLYNFHLKPGKIFVGAGPYAGIALSAKNHLYTYVYDSDGNAVSQSNSSNPILLGKGPDELKRLDYGINVMAGFRITKGWEISLGTSWGFANLANVPGLNINNQVKRISIGYFFK